MGEPRIMIAVDAGELAALREEMAAMRRAIEGSRITPAPDWITIGEYADRIGRTRKTVRNWIRDGKIETRREGTITMVRASH